MGVSICQCSGCRVCGGSCSNPQTEESPYCSLCTGERNEENNYLSMRER